MSSMIKKAVSAGVILGVFLVLAGPASARSVAEQARKDVGDSINIRQKTQEIREAWLGEKDKLKQKLLELESINTQLTEINQSLTKEVSNARTKAVELRRQKAEMKEIENNVSPYLEETYSQLENIINCSLPFLQETRKTRLESLRRILDDPQIAVSEKYRKTMEALAAEVEYGNTVEVYKGNITVDGETMLCELFRLGRAMLYFRTLDLARYGYFDPASSSYQLLPEANHQAIGAAMEIASKRRTTQILDLPLGRIAVQ